MMKSELKETLYQGQDAYKPILAHKPYEMDAQDWYMIIGLIGCLSGVFAIILFLLWPYI